MPIMIARTTGDDILTAGGTVTERRSQRIARLLTQHIDEHGLAAGSKLPSENALSVRFGVSRAVIREAIAMLRAEGRVETVQGSGAFVTSPGSAGEHELDALTRSSVSALVDLIRVRRVVEGEIAALAAATRTVEQMAAIDRAFDRLRLVQQAGASGVAEDRAFHASIADACGNDYWRKIVRLLARPTEVAIGVTRSNEAMKRQFSEAVDGEHRAIRDAIADGDAELARRTVLHHLDQSIERIRSADKSFWTVKAAAVSRLSEYD